MIGEKNLAQSGQAARFAHTKARRYKEKPEIPWVQLRQVVSPSFFVPSCLCVSKFAVFAQGDSYFPLTIGGLALSLRAFHQEWQRDWPDEATATGFV
jgi:hypothetical protein